MKNMKSILFGVSVLVLGISMIGFISKETNREVCEKVMVSIDNQLDNHFIDKNDVINIINSHGSKKLEGQMFNQLNIRFMEKQLVNNSYIADAQIYKQHKGVLLVKVLLRRPIARLVYKERPDFYISESGKLLPISEKYSSRVLLVTGDSLPYFDVRSTLKGTAYQDLLQLIHFIKEDPFWKSQISQINYQSVDDIVLVPQVTKQRIEFGSIIQIADKFRRLKIFYKQILPRKGWNSYKRVNLKFENQIICE